MVLAAQLARHVQKAASLAAKAELLRAIDQEQTEETIAETDRVAEIDRRVVVTELQDRAAQTEMDRETTAATEMIVEIAVIDQAVHRAAAKDKVRADAATVHLDFPRWRQSHPQRTQTSAHMQKKKEINLPSSKAATRARRTRIE